MRIKSDFKDYYDGISRYDEDRETLYLRRTITEKFTLKNLCPIYMKPYSECNGLTWSFSTIGFCGQLYHRVEMGFVANSSASLVWSLEGLDNLIKTSFASQHWKAYNEGWNRKNTYDWCYCHRKHNFSDFFNLPRHSAKVDALFLRAPVWICGSDEITFNPRLASTGFQKIFDVQQAYQTLRVWLCNQAAPNKPIPEVSNADMIVAKGFDLKSSFRKPKDS